MAMATRPQAREAKVRPLAADKSVGARERALIQIRTRLESRDDQGRVRVRKVALSPLLDEQVDSCLRFDG
jgi:hypothetical protein